MATYSKDNNCILLDSYNTFTIKQQGNISRIYSEQIYK